MCHKGDVEYVLNKYIIVHPFVLPMANLSKTSLSHAHTLSLLQSIFLSHTQNTHTLSLSLSEKIFQYIFCTCTLLHMHLHSLAFDWHTNMSIFFKSSYNAPFSIFSKKIWTCPTDYIKSSNQTDIIQFLSSAQQGK